MNVVLYIVGAVALSITLITAVVRVNDIGLGLTSWRWHLRRLGFILVGCGCVALLVEPMYTFKSAAWFAAAFYWGIALVWITTPHMPPWWKYITGTDNSRALMRRATDREPS